MKNYEINQFGIDNLELVERPMPEPGPGEVLVKVRAASLNYRDLMIAKGTYNPRMKLPAVPLSDAAGEIVSVGEGAKKWADGARVSPIFAQGWIDGESSVAKARTALGAGALVRGTASEYVLFDQEGLVEIPGHLSYEEAAAFPCAAVTAWNALVVSGKLKAGDTVLTLGTGGVSIFALQFAKLFGARVISTSSSDEKLERLKELGADDVINYREREDWDSAVLEITGKRGVDHVVEVGGTGTLGRSVNAVRYGGHVALIGALTTSGDFNAISAFMKAIRLQGIFVGSRKMFEDMNRAVELHKLKPVVDRVFGFDELRDALKFMESGSHFGKIVISY